ncbi:MAG: VOC family protein [Verrucomicrobia bacterium]|nr:VOC family protein [Verrucomicrobiota bacterium]
MPAHLAAVSYLVRDYDEAIAWFTQKLGFRLIEDTPLSDTKRWVVVAPPGAGAGGASLLLARAANDEQRAQVGRAAGGRVAFFLHTDDFAREHAAFLACGVRFREAPRRENYGTVAVFDDLYGNGWDLIELQPRV